jgi:hypothetical protein
MVGLAFHGRPVRWDNASGTRLAIQTGHVVGAADGQRPPTAGGTTSMIRHLLTSVAPASLAALAVPMAQAAPAPEAAGFAAEAASAPAPVRAAYGDIFPFYGDIFPFYGDIFPFAGDAKAAYGDIFPFAGQTTAAYGDIFPFYGDIFPFYGDIFPFAGETRASYGDIFPFYGDIFPFAGSAKASYGDIFPFYGDIFPFAGETQASYGDIFPFYGDIFPFAGQTRASYGDIFPFYGDIFPFAGDAQASYGDIFPFYGDIFPFADLTSAEAQMTLGFAGLMLGSEAHWTDAVTRQTGQSFWDGFAANLFVRYGLDRNDPRSFTGLSQLDQMRFLMDWRDGLMQFSGKDRLDYWMAISNWSPGLSRSLSAGSNTVIGVVDFKIADRTDLGDRLILSGGYDIDLNSHGAAVAGLLAAAHDGRGAMGLTPGASIAAWNPFDETGSAGWTDIRLGMQAVLGAGASVVNMSLGVPHHTFHSEWANVYSHDQLRQLAGNAVFVHAAGNQGVAQMQDIDWSAVGDVNLIVVGSIGPTGEISQFSNTPGFACLTVGGECSDANRLMNRFLVAPGEWILVSDGAGGVERRSGTSYATPMVAGAAALLQDRWGWLKQHPGETADILLQTATDLGAPGVDEVYGRGLLNIAASQMPLNVRNLYWLSPDSTGGFRRTPLAFAIPGSQRVWDAGAATAPVYEDVGRTFRDFALPVDALLVGTRERSADAADALQAFMHDSFINGFAGGARASARMGASNGWDVTMSVSPLPYLETRKPEDLPFAMEVEMRSEAGLTVRTGRGHGAMALAGADAGRLDPSSGGMNPLLGLASGGAYSKVEIPAWGGRLDIGVTERTFEHVAYLPFSNEELQIYKGLQPYQSAAANIAFAQPLGRALTVSASYVYLREEQGLLGVQSLAPGSFEGASETDAVTLGATWAPSGRIRFDGSMTWAQTRSQGAQALISVGEDGLRSSAFEASMSIDGVFGKRDRARLSLLQPLHLEDGAINLNSVSVVDRELGLLGTSLAPVEVGTRARRLALEVFYAVPAFRQRGEIAGFVRTEAESAEGQGGQATHILGGQVSLRF